jgi:hypothetical protein
MHLLRRLYRICGIYGANVKFVLDLFPRAPAYFCIPVTCSRASTVIAPVRDRKGDEVRLIESEAVVNQLEAALEIF